MQGARECVDCFVRDGEKAMLVFVSSCTATVCSLRCRQSLCMFAVFHSSGAC